MSKEISKTPLALRMLKRMLTREDHDQVYNSLMQEFRTSVKEKGRRVALLHLWWKVLSSLPGILLGNLYWRRNMFRYYLRMALRNFARRKGVTLINSSGLVLGMAAVILILFWVQDEINFDSFHENGKNIYRVIQGSGGSVTCAPLAPALKTHIPEVLMSSRYRPIGARLIKWKGRAFQGERFSLVDADFFRMFSFPLLRGDADTVFKNPHSVVLTQETAKNFFGSEDPMGQILNIEGRFDFKVTGIIQDFPGNSHIRADLLAPFPFLNELWGEDLNSWGGWSHLSYVLLNGDSDVAAVTDKVNRVAADNLANDPPTLQLLAMEDVYLSKYRQWLDVEKGSWLYVYVFSITAFLVLIIACINYINLSTAQSTLRTREIGMRKIVGARKNEILKQFFGESLLMSLASFLVAVLLAVLLLPILNNLSGKQLNLQAFTGFSNIVGLLAIAVTTGILAGGYPALLASSFGPVQFLRTRFSGGRSGNTLLRKTLVVFQFSLTIVLIAFTIIIFKQVDYTRKIDLGYERANIISMPVTGNLIRRIVPRAQEIRDYPDIVSLSFSGTLPCRNESTSSKITWAGKDPNKLTRVEIIYADDGFDDTFNLRMVKGRYFSLEYMSDLVRGVVINESLMREMGLKEENVLGQRLTNMPNGGYRVITGVVKDFHSRSLHDTIRPLIVEYTRYNDNLSLRIRPGKVPEVLAFLREYWSANAPDYTFNYRFFDEDIDNLYRKEQRLGTLLGYFTILAVFTSALGLVGLSSFMVNCRRKEIGVRKVLGATVRRIVALLSKDFLLLVLIANAIAWPAAIYLIKRWFQNFAYHTELELWMLGAAGGLALLVSFLSVSYQSIKGASTNPVDSLRYE